MSILRDYLRVRADNGLLLSLIATSEMDGKPIQNWYAELEKLRQLPAYVAQLADIEQQISQADVLTPDTDLIELVAKLRPPDFQN
jgi:hypothetical protein